MQLVLFKLCFSALIGLLLGVEREIKRKPLGVRTSMVICIASCLITIISIEYTIQFSGMEEEGVRMDPLRLAAQIVSGVGFLGAGVIMWQGVNITGLTTAALIWAASGMGIAVGAGFWKEALIALVLIIVSVEIIPLIIKFIGPMRLKEKEFNITLIVDKGSSIERINEQVEKNDIVIQKVKIQDLKDEEIRFKYRVSTHIKKKTTEVYKDLKNIKGVAKVDVETF